MATYISLIRGVNVGERKILNKDLIEIYTSLGLEEIKTYIQSDNVIFNHSKDNIEEVNLILEEKIREKYFSVSIFILTLDEFKNIIDKNPFFNEDLEKIYITFLREKQDNLLIDRLEDKKKLDEQFQMGEKVVYLYLPHGYGRTGLNNNYLERVLKTKATTRNWKTVNGIYELASKFSILL